jgi:hypothetical protein
MDEPEKWISQKNGLAKNGLARKMDWPEKCISQKMD